ncbi:MAG: hypothetical protein JSW61_14710 [Candidatus Thorarchaeota archaeon]|nr:MAG: hypothetical protein JSW61_14710 [Candidatus Thorarchaeota archaeon]
MTYEHKHAICTKKTKEIIGDIMRFGKSEYEITMSGVSRGEAEKEDDDSVTIESQRIEKESEKAVDPEESSDEINVMEHYAPIREMDFEPKEAQEVFEKKKKGRNYLEFREDYEAQEE